MVRARLRVMFSLPANVKSHPLPFAVHRLARPELRECYVQSLVEKLADWTPASEDTAEECWNHLRSCVTCSVEEAIGRGIGSRKGGAMGLQPHLILRVLHRILIFTIEIFSFQ